ncbi:MAG: putative toxin-antitoxin system toxin component, PIN family [Egibacteraceae bacterium]
MRLVVDPNVLISAAISAGTCARLVDLWLTQRPFELVGCPTLFAELEEVLTRPKFRRWLDAATAQAYVQRIRDETVLYDDPDVLAGATADPDDDYLVALARETEA